MARHFTESKEPWYRAGATENAIYLSHPCLPDLDEFWWRGIHQGGILCPGRALPTGERQHCQGGGQECESSSLNNRQPGRKAEGKKWQVRMLETLLHKGERKESNINLKTSLPMASDSIFLDCCGRSPSLTMGRNCCPLHARAMTWGESWGSNTSNGGARRCYSPALLPHIKEAVVLLMADETTDLHRVGKIWWREEDQGRKEVRHWRKAQHQSCQYPVPSSDPFGYFGFLHNVLMHIRTGTNYSLSHSNPQPECDRKCDLALVHWVLMPIPLWHCHWNQKGNLHGWVHGHWLGETLALPPHHMSPGLEYLSLWESLRLARSLHLQRSSALASYRDLYTKAMLLWLHQPFSVHEEMKTET